VVVEVGNACFVANVSGWTVRAVVRGGWKVSRILAEDSVGTSIAASCVVSIVSAGVLLGVELRLRIQYVNNTHSAGAISLDGERVEVHCTFSVAVRALGAL